MTTTTATTDRGEPDLRVISLGAGVQSSTLLLLAVEGELTPKPDAAIFADTGWEPKAVYQHLDRLTEIADAAGIPVHRVSGGNLREDALDATKRFASMPLFVRKADAPTRGKQERILRRQCTKEYKIAPIRRKIRELLDDQVRDRWAEQWIGISLDEIHRMKDSDRRFVVNRYPLVERRMTRADCIAWTKARGYPKPPKSACIGCPYNDNARWRARQDDPAEFADAVEFDRKIREAHLDRVGEEAYLHRSLVPLDQVDFSTEEDRGQMTLGFGEECDGVCGV